MENIKAENLNLNINSEASFKELFNTYYEVLTRYAFTFLNNKDEAEDIVQQVFINLWENRTKLEVHTSFRSLLYKAVHNASLNRIKHLKIKTMHANQHSININKYSQHQSIDYNDLNKSLNQALDALPEQCRKIFEMSRFKQLKYHEIADALKLSVKTIENQMGKALKIMRIQLKEYLPILLLIVSHYHHG